MIIKKILRNLLKFYEIPNKIAYNINKYKYKKSVFEYEQNNIFKSLNLNRVEGLENLNKVKKSSLKHLTNEMSSEHEVLFSSISLNKNLNIKKILEIGTYNGYNSLLLSKLFPNSKVTTIDLKDDDKNFKSTYSRKNTLNKFIDERNRNLSQNNNINFLQFNSLKLNKHNEKYDLIWIDGAHGYPVVCIDIINSLHLLNQNGIIMCDDVIKNLNKVKSDKMYNSVATFETLQALENENIIQMKLIYKRLEAIDNCVEKKRKFIAYLNII